MIERNPELFKPRLPKEKISSMQKMVFGTVNKIFIAYEKPFLHPDITEVENVYFWPLPKYPQPPLSLKFLKPIIILITTITKVITLWNPVDEKVVPMEERWFRKIYSFCKGSRSNVGDKDITVSLL